MWYHVVKCYAKFGFRFSFFVLNIQNENAVSNVYSN